MQRNATHVNAKQHNAAQRTQHNGMAQRSRRLSLYATQHNATQRNATQRNSTHHNTTQHNATPRIQHNGISRQSRCRCLRNATQRKETQLNATQHNTTQRNALNTRVWRGEADVCLSLFLWFRCWSVCRYLWVIPLFAQVLSLSYFETCL